MNGNDKVPNVSTFKELLQNNDIGKEQLEQVLAALYEDPWQEVENYSGDLLYEAKTYFTRNQQSSELLPMAKDFNQLYTAALNKCIA